MRLLRVQVPEFRALKDVDISFEPEFTPQVFPLGSLNGGGKSTLLQLIFVSLNCFSNDKSIFFKNILPELNYSHEKIKTLIEITLLVEKQEINFELIYGNRERIVQYISTIDYPTAEIDHNDICVSSILHCNINTDEELINIIANIRKHVFLISPSNQPHLFLTREERRLLFTADNERTYDQVLKSLKDTLPNFYTYDFIDRLTEVYNLETRNDAEERAKTGIYGTHVEQLEKSINSLFIDGKKINPIIPDQQRFTQNITQSVSFKLPSGQEIYPEDLSHGELKRLAIFVLLKHYKIQDSIVLFDEIENGFHPRWQRYIVDDLMEWGASNQYILATHSYQVCDGVTPAHIKELPPHLLPKN